MNISLDCLPCFLKQAVAIIKKLDLPPETAGRVVNRVIAEIAQYERYESTLSMSRSINRILKSGTGLDDPYRDQKDLANRWMMAFLSDLKRRTRKREPFDLAVRLAVAGNIIDLGAYPTIEKQKILDTIESITDADFFIDHGAELKAAADRAERILYIADNAGEIVFDKLLVSRLPAGRVTFVVRGKPVLNDATREDAAAVGIDTIARVIDTGVDVPGLLLSECSVEVLDHFRKADLVLSKGQGNFESLHDEKEKRIFFLFMAKCQRVADMIGCEPGDYIVLDNSRMSF